MQAPYSKTTDLVRSIEIVPGLSINANAYMYQCRKNMFTNLSEVKDVGDNSYGRNDRVMINVGYIMRTNIADPTY